MSKLLKVGGEGERPALNLKMGFWKFAFRRGFLFLIYHAPRVRICTNSPIKKPAPCGAVPKTT